MCGILCYIYKDDNEYNVHYERCKSVIRCRGPDDFGEIEKKLSYNWKARFATSILWMQGSYLTKQPSVDTDGNILLWNGDIFAGSMAQNVTSDTTQLLTVLQTTKNVPETLKNIRGPYSIVYYEIERNMLWFARDPIGRHSLLIKFHSNRKELILTSSANQSIEEIFELPAIGIYSFDLKALRLNLYPWRIAEKSSFEEFAELLKIRVGYEFNVCDAIYRENGESSILYREPEPHEIAFYREITNFVKKDVNLENLSLEDKKADLTAEMIEAVMKRLAERPEVRERIDKVLKLLKRSIELRISIKPDFCKHCVKSVLKGEEIVCSHSKLGILFSGGLDSTILAVLADEFVPRDEEIDLINVAFEKIAKYDVKSRLKNSEERAIDFDVPDRKTGRQALRELRKLCPWRMWNFIECNVTRQELGEYRSSRIRDLVYPLETILDDSLGCALWFAARGKGTKSSLTGATFYESQSRILLLGMGADELFGGYTRHRTILRRGGWIALSRELDEELARISKRNLGRDDRIVSDHGRQSRLPYLDEELVDYVTHLRAWERCCPTELMPVGFGDKLLLRLVAREIGLNEAANFPKRAFQFGSRIANSKENGKDVSDWK